MNKIKTLAINASGFAFDPINGESFTLNEVGIEIISLLTKDKTIKEITEKVSEDYDVEYEQCYTDVLEFINKLKNYELVDNS